MVIGAPVACAHAAARALSIASSERLGLLRARQRRLAVEDEERHAGRRPSRARRASAVGHLLPHRIREHEGARVVGIVARLRGDARRAPRDRPRNGLDEIGAEERLHQRLRIAFVARLRPRDEPVRIERIGLARDRLEVEVDADGAARGAHALVDLRRALRPAELRLEVRLAIHAGRRQLGIELERMPADVHGQRRDRARAIARAPPRADACR